MKRRGLVVILFLSILLMFLLISCSSDVFSDFMESTAPPTSIPVTSIGIRLEPVSSEYYDQIKNYGVPREDEEGTEKFLFRYRCEKIPEAVDAWIEIYENGTTRYGHSSSSKKELIPNSFQKMNAVLLEKEAMLAPDTESLLMALLYDNQKETPNVSLTEIQHDAALMKQAELGILLKCSISSE